MIPKLTFASLRREKTRLVIAMLGVAAATGLIVWSLGLAMTARRQTTIQANRMAQPYTSWVSTSVPFMRGAPSVKRLAPMEALPDGLRETLEGLPGISRVDAHRTLMASLDYRPGGRVMQGPPMMATLALAPAAGSPYEGAEVRGEWPDPEDSEPVAAVVTSIFTPRRLEPPPLGSTLVVVTRTGTVTVRIGAYIELPRIVWGFPTMFVTKGAMRQATGLEVPPQSPNLLLCTGNARGDAAAYKAAMEALDPEGENREEAELHFSSTAKMSDQLSSDALTNFRRQAPLLLTLAVLTAICMLVNALSIGIEQRLRVMALLRTVGLTARQAAQLVAFEGLVIAVGGWLLGVAAGRIAIEFFVRSTIDVFPAGAAMGWVTPVATAGGVALVTALSLFFPCRKALRIRPLEMFDDPQQELRPINRARSFLGFALLFPMLILALPLPITAKTRSALILLAGLPLHFLGLYMVMPFFVRLVERIVMPPLAAILGLDQRLLRWRSSRHFPRTFGMMMTLAVGLGSFIAIHVWGASLTAVFIPSKEFPDVIVSILPNGVPLEDTARLGELEGVADRRCLALEAAQFNVTEDLVERITAIESKPPFAPNMLVLGADPQAVFGGEKPLASFRFVEGNRHNAAEALEAGGACVVSRMFTRMSGLGVGDTITLKVPVGGYSSGGRPGSGEAPRGSGRGAPGSARPMREETFTIAGVVDVNWHLLTSRANVRGRNNMSYGALSPAFMSEAEARRLTGNTNTTHFLWANLSDSYSALGELAAGQKLEGDIRHSLGVADGNTIRVHHRDEISDGTIAHSNDLVGAMARAPFWALIVLATGVVTLLIASVRASARELSTMRMVGMTRGQLSRMLLGEALSATIGGIALSLLSGMAIGWTFTGWTRAFMSFGGLPLALSVPWPTLLRGIGFAFGLCLAMALPALHYILSSRSRQETTRY